MNGFVGLLRELVLAAGMDQQAIFHKKALELPGFYRPTKKWDLLVVRNGQLIAALEAKSQVGSFGNNCNNRAEEVIGNAVDLWTAYREGAFNKTLRPWLGYLVLLEDCDKSRKPVKLSEPHFKAFPEFKSASYQKRYEILCRKLVRERHYDATSLLISDRDSGHEGNFAFPAEDLTFEVLARSLWAHVAAHAQG